MANVKSLGEMGKFVKGWVLVGLGVLLIILQGSRFFASKKTGEFLGVVFG